MSAADTGIRCIRAGSGGNETDFLPQITSYDYSAPISEAGGTGQPGIGGADKFAARGPAAWCCSASPMLLTSGTVCLSSACIHSPVQESIPGHLTAWLSLSVQRSTTGPIC